MPLVTLSSKRIAKPRIPKIVPMIPNTHADSLSINEGLENTNSRVKKFHRLNIAERKECKAQTTVLSFSTPFKNFSFIDF